MESHSYGTRSSSSDRDHLPFPVKKGKTKVSVMFVTRMWANMLHKQTLLTLGENNLFNLRYLQIFMFKRSFHTQ